MAMLRIEREKVALEIGIACHRAVLAVFTKRREANHLCSDQAQCGKLKPMLVNIYVQRS